MREYLIAGLFLFIISACQHQPAAPNLEVGFANLIALKKLYPELESPEARQYLQELMHELKASDIEVLLLDSNKPIAVSPATKLIALSRAVITICENESQLAFILAHEISHHRLGHVEQSSDHALSKRQSKQFELDADASALGLMSRAGINPATASDTLKKFHPLFALSDEHYPSIDERLAHIIESLKTLPQIGIIDTYAFRLIKSSLEEG